jgi:uncharacterized protein YjbJ (UPF0337 family)
MRASAPTPRGAAGIVRRLTDPGTSQSRGPTDPEVTNDKFHRSTDSGHSGREGAGSHDLLADSGERRRDDRGAGDNPGQGQRRSDEHAGHHAGEAVMSLPSVDEMKGVWKQRVGAAKIAWGKLTEDELLRLEGHEQKLAGLVQERYAITRDEADKQVKSFFDKFKPDAAK